MTRSKLALPPGAMPWGRWVERNVDDVANGISVQAADASSAGSTFAARSDLLSQQIGSIPSVAAIYQRTIPVFSVTRTFNSAAVAYVYDSPVQTFNPPRPDRSYSYTVFANMVTTGTTMTFARSLIRTNGVDNMYQHENLQPGYNTLGTFSIVGSGNIGSGGTVSAQMAVIAQAAGTVTFNSAEMWCVFSGSIF